MDKARREVERRRATRGVVVAPGTPYARSVERVDEDVRARLVARERAEGRFPLEPWDRGQVKRRATTIQRWLELAFGASIPPENARAIAKDFAANEALGWWGTIEAKMRLEGLETIPDPE